MKPTKAIAARLAQPAIEPPESWQQKTPFGFMGVDSTPGGRLVRLADVLRWLCLHPSPKPHAAALDALCDAMPGDVMQWLYQAQPDGYAKPIPIDWMFGYKTAMQIQAANAKARQDAMQRDHVAKSNGRFGGVLRCEDGKVRMGTQQPVEPGQSALLKHLRAAWGHEIHAGNPAIDHKNTVASYLAIPLDKAAIHWGYGRALDAVVSDSAFPLAWTGAKLAAQIAVFKASGHKDYARRTWDMAGIKEREGRRLVQDYEESISPKAVSSVFDMGIRVPKKATKRA